MEDLLHFVMELINPWVLCVPDSKNMDYFRHKFLALSVPNCNQKATHFEKTSLELFDSFEERHFIPIFTSKKDCFSFRDDILIQQNNILYDDWRIEDSSELSTNCISVQFKRDCSSSEEALDNNRPTHILPVPFDLTNQDVILTMSLQSYMGFFVVNQFNMSNDNTLLTLQGVVVDSSYESISNEEHLQYMTQILEEYL